MRYPNLSEEKKLWKRGFKEVVGLDEAGRGPLAGPVVAAAVVVKQNIKNKNLAFSKNLDSSLRRIKKSKQIKNKKNSNLTIKQFSNLGIRDSKRLTPKKREELYKILTNSTLIEWGIGRVYESVIDKINILEATKLAMKRAVEKLKTKNKKQKINFLILDGNFKIDYSHGPIRIPRGRGKRRRGLGYSDAIPQKSIVKADNKVFSCAVASIIAKVTRDRIMVRFCKKYSQYDFSRHKGYATKYHLKMLKKHGPCRIHRKSFRPIRGKPKIKDKKLKTKI